MKRSVLFHMCVLFCALGCSLDRSPAKVDAPAPVDPAAAPMAGEVAQRAVDFGNPDNSPPPPPMTALQAPAEEPPVAAETGAGAGMEGAAGAAGGAEAPPEPKASQAPANVDAGPDADPEAPTDAPVEPPVEERFADCESDGDCLVDETCVQTGTIAFCAQTCRAGDACEPPEAGPASVCGATFPDGEGFCRIPCDLLIDDSCPGGMVCQDPLPMFPAGTGTCGYPI